MPVGGDIIDNGSLLFNGPIGNVYVSFNGYLMGYTTAETTMQLDKDVADITYQQEGTKASDHVVTGVDVLIQTTFAQPSAGLFSQLLRGEIEIVDGTPDTGGVIRSLYRSLRENEAKPLRLSAVDSDGCPSEETADNFWFYEAIPVVTDNILNWVADAQRGVPTMFRVKYHKFADGESATKKGAFGYWGDPTLLDYPAVVWPDVAAPQLVSATVQDATDVDIVFNEDIAFQGGSFTAGDFYAEVNGVFVLATSAVISSDTVTVTFPAATFSASDVVKIGVSEGALEDTDASANTYGGVSGYPADNPL